MSKYTDMENEVKKIKARIKGYDQRIEELEGLETQYYRALSLKEDTKNGNRFLIAAGVLLALMLIGTFFGYELEESDYIIIGGVLAIGLIRKIFGWCTYLLGVAPYGGAKKTRDEEERVRAELSEQRAKRKNADKKLKKLTTYDGKDWDLKTFRATPENICAMERDVDRLFMCLWWGEKPKGWKAYKDIWMYTASVRDVGFREMGNSGNWKLQVAQVVIECLYQIRLLRGAASATKIAHLWYSTFEESKVREPQTQEEKEYWELAKDVAVFILGHATRSEMEEVWCTPIV